MILATEMTKHFEHLAKFVSVYSKPQLITDEEKVCFDDTMSITLKKNHWDFFRISRLLLKPGLRVKKSVYLYYEYITKRLFSPKSV